MYLTLKQQGSFNADVIVKRYTMTGYHKWVDKRKIKKLGNVSYLKN